MEIVWPHAALVYANHADFAPGGGFGCRRLESRFLLICREGRGWVDVSGQRLDLEPGRWYLMPWGGSLLYQADIADPFRLSGLHIIPFHARNRAIEYWAAHNPEEPLADSPGRRDAPLGGYDGLLGGDMTTASGLRHLSEFVVHCFARGNVEEWQSRYLARMLVDEILRAAQAPGQPGPAVPGALDELMRHVQSHFDDPLTLNDLVDVSELSPATINRLFKRHLGVTPGRWILLQRMYHARNMLRTTRRSVAEIGRACGFEDPAYFAKVFKRVTGESPRAWRSRHPLI